MHEYYIWCTSDLKYLSQAEPEICNGVADPQICDKEGVLDIH